MRISVLMSLFSKERPDYFDLSMKSVWNDQTRKPDEIVLVEDGPVTTELESIVNKWQQKIPVMKVVKLEKNQGLPVALNEGIKQCNCDYIARMDTDDIALPDRFKIQEEYLNIHPELVKLGNYFGYDINCEENCCFLPCWENGDGYGDKTSHFKKAQAYEVMKASGMQWHVGQHDYKISIPDNMKEKYPELKTIDCYNDKINKDINELSEACNKRFKGKCLEKNYEEYRHWFIERMNILSGKIEKHLNLFSQDPKKSYPYFVSAEALRYAYEVPRSGKVILIYPTKTQWIVKRYRYTNYLKDEDIQLNLQATQALAVAENHRDETIRKLIFFCENVSCFLIVDKTESFHLPFGYQVKYQYINAEESEKVKSHFSAMLAEQADDEEDEYISPKAMAVKRLKECGLL